MTDSATVASPAVVVPPLRVPLDALVARINEGDLFPAFRDRVRELLSTCQVKSNADYYATSGFRSWDEQAALHMQGRLTPSWNASTNPPLGTPVTNARAGESAHNFGIAIDATRDSALDRRGLQPDHRMEAYEPYARHAKEIGLDAAYYWTGKLREGYHVQLNIASRGLDLSLLRTEYRRWADKAYAMKRIFDIVRAHGPW